jgi:hypothetical protein
MMSKGSQFYRFTLAMSLSVFSLPCWADTPVNTVNNGSVIQGGLYLNTPDSKTTFTNTAGTGIWLKNGSNLRAVESNANGAFTNNGGTVQISAPNQVVRLDGNIDVRGLRDGSGQYLGSGGKVFVDADYLFQNGNIYASGYQGGLVQFNVGGATISSGARIEANGVGSSSSSLPSDISGHPLGGTIAINSKGPVDILSNTVLQAQGGSGDVNIEAGVVNLSGLVQADGAAFEAGTIRLISTGQSKLAPIQSAIQTATNHGVLTASESMAINNRMTNLVTNHDGDIIITAADNTHPRAVLSTRTAILAAERNINNGGWISTDGNASLGEEASTGGVISLNAASTITNTGRISASGLPGAPAGIIALSYKDGMSNTGSIVANGDHGGLIDFHGPVNPTGNGLASALSYAVNPFGNGTVVAPNPLTTTNRLIGVWDRTRPREVLFGNFNFNGLIFLGTQLPGSNVTNSNLNTWIYTAKIRNLYDQRGTGLMGKDVEDYYLGRSSLRTNPIIVSSNDGSTLDLNGGNIFATPTSLTVLTNGNVTLSSPLGIGYNDVRFNASGDNDYADSIRGQLSIISNSLTLKSSAGFAIFGQTDYMFQHIKRNVGAPFDKIYQTLDMGPGSARIATKTSFTGTNSQFHFIGGQDPSLIIQTQNP